MDIFMIILRIIHILFGIFWVGTTFFFVLFFDPIIKASGPAGGRVMGQLTLTRFSMLMGISSIFTVVSGVIMYVLDSDGLQFTWIFTSPGITLGIGSLAGILASLVGFTVQMPTSARMTALQKEIQAAGGQPTPAQLQEMQVLQKKNYNCHPLGSGIDGDCHTRHGNRAGTRKYLINARGIRPGTEQA